LKKIIAVVLALLLSGCACITGSLQLPDYSIPSDIKQSTVEIVVTCDSEPTSGGSGVVIKKTKKGRLHILTAAHILENPCKPKETAATFLWKEQSRIAEVTLKLEILKLDAPNDLALVATVEAIDQVYPVVRLAKNSPALGEGIWSAGNPLLAEYSLDTVNSGTVSKELVPWKWGGLPRMQITSALAPGMSGGGVFNQRGELVGLNVAGLATSKASVQGFSFAVRCEVIKDFLRKSNGV
jgi:S1-C subfamily serine protease